MSEEHIEKKAWSVFAVVKTNSMDDYAEDLERKLNKLDEKGYQMTFMHWMSDDSVIVVGRLQHLLLGMLPLGAKELDSDLELEGHLSKRLFSVAIDNLDTEATDKDQKDLTKVIVEQVMGRAPAEEVQKSLKDCDAALKHYRSFSEKEGISDDNVEGRHITKTLSRLKKALNDKLQLQLQ